MHRATTARTGLSTLAAVLVALQLLTTASFTSAHMPRHAVAGAPFGTKPSGTTSHDEALTCRDLEPPGDPIGPPRTRDRHRAADKPAASGRPSPPRPAPTAPRPATRGAADPSSARTPGLRSIAALQAFRC
ncbi:hypothetical protein GCM10010275_65000 [Streptomyces litmocidini]|uniref:hypothetical protein n=1 Tax=Streptomyces litmocidini TaxID=67318 RepID=UPI00167E74B4|nr:hypothetical protein [Streptomyces litmocidini]GGV14678.1 hypothetical protein GCM10010275_65000 [Streptomyces litmocidini]